MYMKKGKSRWYGFLALLLTIMIGLTLFPLEDVMAKTKSTNYKEKDYTVKNCSGTVYIPTQLANLVQSQAANEGAWGEYTSNNEAYVINSNTKITWNSADYKNVVLYGFRISQHSNGRYMVDIMQGIGYKDPRIKIMNDYSSDWGKDFIKLGAFKDFTLHHNDGYSSNWVDGYGNIYWEKDIAFPTAGNGTDFVYDIYALRLCAGKAEQKILLLVPENLTKIAYESEKAEYIYQDVEVNCLTEGYGMKYIKSNVLQKKSVSFDSQVEAYGKLTYTVGTGYAFDGEKSVSCDAKKYISIDENGKITVKKGTPNGYYQIRVNAQKKGKYAKTYAWFTIYVGD